MPACEARRLREARLHQADVKCSNQISVECIWFVQQTLTKCLRGLLDCLGEVAQFSFG